MNQKKIGKFIQEKRKEKNLTQIELAEKLGVSNRTISKWENGNCLPDYSILKPLCSELNISINELLSGEQIENNDYNSKSEENMINITDYNNKLRKNKIRKIILFILFIVAIYFIYKIFVLFFYDSRSNIQTDKKTFPYNKNIATLNIKTNNLANRKFGDNDNKIYIPEEFELVTDKAKSSMVIDNCDLYIKNLIDNNNFDSSILVCSNTKNNIYNLDHFGINSSIFPYLTVYPILQKYNINDIIDLLKFYEKNYKFKANIFTNSSLIKMNYIARTYASFSVPSYKDFYYLSGNLKGYYLKNNSNDKNTYQAVLVNGNNSYSISTISSKEKKLNYFWNSYSCSFVYFYGIYVTFARNRKYFYD